METMQELEGRCVSVPLSGYRIGTGNLMNQGSLDRNRR